MKHWIWLLAFFLEPPPVAASPLEATFTGVNGTMAFGLYVGPYYGKLDGQFVTLNCIDFANNAYFGEMYAANLSRINSPPDLANTRYGALPNALQLYQEAAWLTTQYDLNP